MLGADGGVGWLLGAPFKPHFGLSGITSLSL
jgi:hypothetical protein